MRRLLVASLVAVSAPGCSEPADDGRLRGVVLVLLDTVRADHLGCYGYERPTSPHLDALAAEGVRFARAVSPAPWTLPSVASLLAGQYSGRVFQSSLESSTVEALRDAGITTAAFTEGGFVTRRFGLDRGFDHWIEEEGAVQLVDPDRPFDLSRQGGIERTFAAAERWLGERDDERFFLFVHTYEPHTPYTNHDFTDGLARGRLDEVFGIDDVGRVQDRQLVLTERETEYVEALYDGDIASADRHVGRLRERLRDLGLSGRVALIVTSDHGEELGEHYPHNTGDHGHALLDTQVRVPLILHDPTRERAVPVVDAQVSLMDVMPTVADLLDVTLPSPLDGRTLLPLVSGSETRERPVFLAEVKSGPMRVGLSSRGFKYLVWAATADERPPLSPEPPVRQLYDLVADPHELDDLHARRPELVQAFEQILGEHHPGLNALALPDLVEQADPLLVERLRSLGYVR